MGVVKRVWQAATAVVAVYSTYNQLKTMANMKDDLYKTLSPEQQAEWAQIFGVPGQAIPTPGLPPLVSSLYTSAATKPVTQVSQVKAGV